MFSLTANAFNFSSSSTCDLTSSDDSLVKFKSKRFSLSSSKTKKTIKVRVPLTGALDLITNSTSKTVTISITCNNGASEQADVLITPNIDTVIENKLNWRILKSK